MMILSQDGMVAVNSDNVAMFEVKETETIPHEAQLMATIFISGGGRYTNAERTCCPIGTFRSPDRTVQHQLRPQGLCAGSDRR
mgnify:CR=1 FL=1